MTMSKITEAEKYIKIKQEEVKDAYYRNYFHFMPRTGWMNDPNGFVFYNGEYHIFYQYHPFSPEWGPMYWGHAKSKDLVHWQHLPIAMAPDQSYDLNGCFSGSALSEDDKLILMYTGHRHIDGDINKEYRQTQCIAESTDGITFTKDEKNPVIKNPPDFADQNNFRDPKLWKDNDLWYVAVGSRDMNNKGQILLYESKDLYRWSFKSVLAKETGHQMNMWECPDFFKLGGNDVLIVSRQPYNSNTGQHDTVYCVGEFDKSKSQLAFSEFEKLDFGFDFYAPQTIIDQQGRRILIAWMQMWGDDIPSKVEGWAGALTIPRILTVKGKNIYSNPAPELELLRKKEIKYNGVHISGEVILEGFEGDVYELVVEFENKTAKRFGLKVRIGRGEETVFTYYPDNKKLIFDRNLSGIGPKGINSIFVDENEEGRLFLHVFVDKSSVEAFVNQGEKVLTGRIYPSKESKGICFFSDGKTLIREAKIYELKRVFE